jgi:hypothetical protein
MHPPESSQVDLQLVWLFVLAIPIASVAWTITHEEVFRELRQFRAGRSEQARWWCTRKFFTDSPASTASVTT